MKSLKNSILVNIVILCILILSLPAISRAGDTLVLTCNDAIAIALDKSFSLKTNLYTRTAAEHYYRFYKAMFKPRIDVRLFAPSLNESVSPVQQADGLPVYNSSGITQFGGTLKYTYMLSTGGNVALNSQLYRENLKTRPATGDFKELRAKQAYSSISLNFTQPLFTDNILKENLKEARLRFEQSSWRFTREQMDIVFRVTYEFNMLYRTIREKEIIREKLKNSEEAYRIAQIKFRSGRIPEGDVLIAEIAESRDRADLLESEGKLERIKDSFKQSIGLEPDVDIDVTTDLKYDVFVIDMDKAI